jgi:hypothetical protein
MGVCDVCNKELGEREGYLLTTLEVVSTPGYWKKAFSGSMGAMMSAFGMSDDASKAQLASQMASQTTPWMICDQCIGIFPVDKGKTRQYALRWYDSGGTFAPPGSGPAPLSKVNMGDGKVYMQGGSPEAMRLADRLRSAQAPKKASSCFIATAAFTPWSPEVDVLRRFRDGILTRSRAGRLFVSVYYRVSPPLARWIAASSPRRRVARGALLPVVKLVRKAMGDD